MDSAKALHAAGSYVQLPRPLLAQELPLILAFFIAAFLVRLFNIGALPLWVDEGASLAFALAPLEHLWGPIATNESNPPGYFTLLKAWIWLFGPSDISLRMPSAIAGALGVIPLYIVAFRQHGRAAAVIATGLFVVSAILIQYSQEARSYALISLVFLLGMLIANRVVDDLERGRAPLSGMALLVLSCVVLPYLHVTGFVVVAVLFVYLFTLLLFNRLLSLVVVRDMVIAGMIIVVSTTPVLYWIALQVWIPVQQGLSEGHMGWVDRPSLPEALEIYRRTFGHTFVYRDTPRNIADGLLFFVVLLSVVLGVRRRNPHVIAVVVSLSFLMLTYYVVSQIHPILIPRIVVFAVPLVFLLAGFALTLVPWKRAMWAIAVVLVVLQTANLSRYFLHYEKEQWREMVLVAHEYYSPSAALIIAGPAIALPVIIDRYWPGTKPERQFVVPSGYTNAVMALHDVMLPLQPRVSSLDAGRLCDTLRDYDSHLVIARVARGERALEAIVVELRSCGGALLEEWEFGRSRDVATLVGLSP
jgi:mannosyltransferase